jgi:hypothetical protein
MGFKGRSLAYLLLWTTRREHVYEVFSPGKAALGQFRNWCRPHPDFLWSFVGQPNCMRLSAKKAAHRFSLLVPRYRKSGKR